MGLKNSWNFTPYIPVNLIQAEKDIPHIVRIAPGVDFIDVEVICKTEAAVIYFGLRSTDYSDSISFSGKTIRIPNLKTDTDYVFYIEDSDGRKSKVRIARTGYVDGTVVNYLHPEDEYYAFSGRYLASPSIIKAPDNSLLASMDVFGHDTAQNLTLLFCSKDNGNTWHYKTDLINCFWGKMFRQKDRLYMLGVTSQYGSLVIGYSDDCGDTWSAPQILIHGSAFQAEGGVHKAPVPVIRSHGKIYSAIEYGTWDKKYFDSAIIWADENSDLSNPESWNISPFIRHDKSWENSSDVIGGIEGNVVETPDGSIVNMLRYHNNKTLVHEFNPHEDEYSFKEIRPFEIGHSKFDILKTESGYLAVGNRLPLRTILSVYKSNDLYNWELMCDVVNHGDMPEREIGFQYPSFIKDNQKLYILSRTAFNGSPNHHDSNYITFHTVDLK